MYDSRTAANTLKNQSFKPDSSINQRASSHQRSNSPPARTSPEKQPESYDNTFHRFMNQGGATAGVGNFDFQSFKAE